VPVLAGVDKIMSVVWDEKIMSVVRGRIDEIHILSAVRAAPMVGYLSPSQICKACAIVSSIPAN
jgi:hypothetical protein